VQESILSELRRIERAEDVRVLLAVESGSRAWGFESATSDWDVRFIYVRRPERYLSIRHRSDVIERQTDRDLDITGWDLRKALLLFAKPNMPLLEWLRSPIVYVEYSATAQHLRDLSTQFFSARACLYHYLNMARGNNRNYLSGDSIRLKDYFYVLRPVLACRWIEGHETMPPVKFIDLVNDQLPFALRALVEELLLHKRSGIESAAGPRIDAIHEFLDSEIARIGSCIDIGGRETPPDLSSLDELFVAALREVWA
jgi:predicted nucleotidyltransferase